MDNESLGLNGGLQGFTPVRRPKSTVNIRPFQASQEKEWTAARCHRLLRALTSRVAILNRELARYPATSQDYTESKGSKAGAASKSRPGDVDADWTQARKKIRKTYSNRGIRHDNTQQLAPPKPRTTPPTTKGPLVPGEVSIPTPLLVRARGDFETDNLFALNERKEIKEPSHGKNKRPRTCYISNDGETLFPLSERLRTIKQKTSAARYTTLEGIYNGLEVLLRATTPDEPEMKRKGPRSLLSMSLRAVPRYIAHQEAILQNHIEETSSKSAIARRDISTEIYDELEAFGSLGHGWKRLKYIVRSHGVHVVNDAIRAGLLDIEFCDLLITLCVQVSATDEAETLLSAVVSSTTFFAPKTVYDTAGHSLSLLWKFTQSTGRYSFQYRQMSLLVSSGHFPTEWMATREFSSVWTNVIQSLSPELKNEDALTFLYTSLTSLSSKGRSVQDSTNKSTAGGNLISEAIQNTFISLLTTLSSIVILSQDADKRDSEAYPLSYEHIKTLLLSCLIQHGDRIPTNAHNTLVVLSNLIVGNEWNILVDSENSLVNVFLEQLKKSGNNFATISPLYTQSVNFICLVAHCCGRGSSSSGFEYLEHLHLLLGAMVCSTSGSNILKGLIVDSAFAFAQKVPNRRHLDYAASVDEKFCARVLPPDMSGQNKPEHDVEEKSGFRWEEGIGEWVTATPRLSCMKRKNAKLRRLNSKSGYKADPRQTPQGLRTRKQTESNITSRPPFHHKYNTEARALFQTIIQSSARPGKQEPTRFLHGDNLNPALPASCGDDNELVAYLVSDNGTLKDNDSFQLEETADLGSEIEALSSETSSCETSSCFHRSISEPSPENNIFNKIPRRNTDVAISTQEWHHFEDSSPSVVSPMSNTGDDYQDMGQKPIHCAPRLGRKALQPDKNWQLFEESEDELSFLSVSSQCDQVLKDVTQTLVPNFNIHPRHSTKTTPSQPKQIPSENTIFSDSEDELCI